MKKVRLRMKLTTGYPIPDDQKELNIVPGLFCLLVDGNPIPFYFKAYRMTLKRKRNLYMTIDYLSGECSHFTDYDVNEIFNGEYEKLGLTREDITAAFLGRATRILTVNMKTTPINVPWIVNEMVFIDENGTEYPISKEILDAYTATL